MFYLKYFHLWIDKMKTTLVPFFIKIPVKNSKGNNILIKIHFSSQTMYVNTYILLS